jgi:hypothetical protein
LVLDEFDAVLFDN